MTHHFLGVHPFVLTALMSLVMFHNAQVTVASPKQTTAQLGQLEVRASHIEGQVIIADTFTGPSRYIERIYVYVSIKNVGESPVCAELIPTIEEYKGLEFWRADPIKSEYIVMPRVRNLAPGKKISGSYAFEPEPAKREYVLVIEQKSASQSCGDTENDQKTLISASRVVRIPLESIDKK
jgi:hypothetical protein